MLRETISKFSYCSEEVMLASSRTSAGVSSLWGRLSQLVDKKEMERARKAAETSQRSLERNKDRKELLKMRKQNQLYRRKRTKEREWKKR